MIYPETCRRIIGLPCGRHNADRYAPPGTDRRGVPRLSAGPLCPRCGMIGRLTLCRDGDLMTAGDVAPWFVVRPGAERKGRVITIPLAYTGSRTLSEGKVFVDGDHVNGVSSGGGEPYHSNIELGDLAPSAEFWLMVRTDGEPGSLTFTLDLAGDGRHLSKFVVQAPEPTSVPAITDQPF